MIMAITRHKLRTFGEVGRYRIGIHGGKLELSMTSVQKRCSLSWLCAENCGHVQSAPYSAQIVDGVLNEVGQTGDSAVMVSITPE